MTVRILIGDVRARLRELPDESVHCIWTSVPYWGLRSYDTEPQVWGGDEACEHAWGEEIQRPRAGAGRPGATSIMVRESRSVITAQQAGQQAGKGCICERCGAWRGEHGLEPTLDMWLANEVTIWQGLRRVLRKDGVAWLNCGDAYATSTNGRSAADTKAAGDDDRTFRDKPLDTAKSSGLKSKQRLMLPARLALALQSDGWWLRDEIVWHKLNPMPSSVNDRTTPAHEMLYLLTRSPRYYFDAFAIMEAASKDSHPRAAAGDAVTKVSPKAALIDGTGKGQPKANASFNAALGTSHLVSMRNKRSVWPLVTEPSSNPHFATAPTSIVDPCIQAGSSEKGCCPLCSAPWKRVTRRRAMVTKPGPTAEAARASAGSDAQGRKILSSTMVEPPSIVTLGWYPSCSCEETLPLPAYPEKPPASSEQLEVRQWEAQCDAVDEARQRLCEIIADRPVVPCTVLDPFGGSGTTALVADRLRRDGIIIELNPKYAEMAHDRVKGETPLFTVVAAE